jgi:hypothetical protein
MGETMPNHCLDCGGPAPVVAAGERAFCDQCEGYAERFKGAVR